MWARFTFYVSQSGSPDRFPSIYNALTAKNASRVSSSFLSLFSGANR